MCLPTPSHFYMVQKASELLSLSKPINITLLHINAWTQLHESFGKRTAVLESIANSLTITLKTTLVH